MTLVFSVKSDAFLLNLAVDELVICCRRIVNVEQSEQSSVYETCLDQKILKVVPAFLTGSARRYIVVWEEVGIMSTEEADRCRMVFECRVLGRVNSLLKAEGKAAQERQAASGKVRFMTMRAYAKGLDEDVRHALGPWAE